MEFLLRSWTSLFFCVGPPPRPPPSTPPASLLCPALPCPLTDFLYVVSRCTARGGAGARTLVVLSMKRRGRSQLTITKKSKLLLRSGKTFPANVRHICSTLKLLLPPPPAFFAPAPEFMSERGKGGGRSCNSLPLFFFALAIAGGKEALLI